MAGNLTPVSEVLRGKERGFFSALQTIEADKAHRLPRRGRPKVIDYEPRSEGASFVPPGSVTLFMAPSGSPFLEEVAAAFSKGDGGSITALQKKISDDGVGRKTVSFARSVRELTDARTYADLRYGSKTLAENLGLPNRIGFGIMSFPYNGGELDPREFELVEYVKNGIEEKLDAILVRRPPRLSRIEHEAIKAVPRDLLEVNIGNGGEAAVTVTTITIVAFVVAMHTPTLTGGGRLAIERVRDRFDLDLAEDRIRQLGPVAGARELLAARHKIFSQVF